MNIKLLISFVIFLIITCCSINITIAQTDPKAIVEEYKKKMANAKSQEEKLRIAKEMQEKVLSNSKVKEAQQKANSNNGKPQKALDSVLSETKNGNLTSWAEITGKQDSMYVPISFNYKRTEKSLFTNISFIGNGSSKSALLVKDASGKINVSVMSASNPAKQQYEQLVTSKLVNKAAVEAMFSLISSVNYQKNYDDKTGRKKTENAVSTLMTGFSFVYDAKQKYAATGAGGLVKTKIDINEFGESKVEEGSQDVGIGNYSNLAEVQLIGVEKIDDNRKSFLNVEKTKYGFKATYTLTEVQGEGETALHINETITAYIGKEDILETAEWEAIFIEENAGELKRWIPRGADIKKPEDGGNEIAIKILVRNIKDTTKIYNKPIKIFATLDSSSHYPGFCSNYPENTDKPDIDADIRFHPDFIKSSEATYANEAYFESVKVNNNFKLRLKSYDYGGIVRLSAVINLVDDDNLEIRAKSMIDKSYKLVIPIDNNNNGIADAWEFDEQILSNNYSKNWDEEVKPDNGNSGDNICLFDEYRGFVVEDKEAKKYLRFSSNKKELVVYVPEKAHSKAVLEGTIGFGKVTDITTYTLNVHSNMSNLVARHSSMNGVFPKWLNYNSPVTNVVTSCIPIWITTQTTYTEQDIINLKTKYPTSAVEAIIKEKAEASAEPLDNVPVGLGAYYPNEVNYIIIRSGKINTKNYMVGNQYKYFHPCCDTTTDKNISCNIDDDKHIANAENLFHIGMNASTFGSDFYDLKFNGELLRRAIVFTVVHELGHATHIHHHNAGKENGDPLGLAYYRNEPNCPMRYWASDKTNPGSEVEKIYYWYLGFWSGKWDPSTLKTPTKQDYKLCSKKDDCWHQLSLKKK